MRVPHVIKLTSAASLVFKIVCVFGFELFTKLGISMGLGLRVRVRVRGGWGW